MIFRLNSKSSAVGIVLSEQWLTTAWVSVIKRKPKVNLEQFKGRVAARQNIKVVMLCQRPTHTHNSKSVAQLISSNIDQIIFKNAYMQLIKRPLISLQLPNHLYQHLIIQKPKELKFTGAWAAALLADEGYNLNEWRWDVVVNDDSCRFLLVKVVDLYDYTQPLRVAGCLPNVLSFIDAERSVTDKCFADDNFAYKGMTVLADPLAANQAIVLAAQALGYDHV